MVSVPENSKGFFRYISNWFDLSRIDHFEIKPSDDIDFITKTHYRIYAVYHTGGRDYLETIMGYDESKEFCKELIDDAVISGCVKHKTNVFTETLS